MVERVVKGKILRVLQGDITERDTEAIVNPANNYLRHEGGVAGAIVRKGGAIIQEESNKIGYVETGKAAITSAGTLKAKYVIHAVGPRWGEGEEREKLSSAVSNSLKLATQYNLRSISFPAISAGIFGVPKEIVSEVLLHTAYKFLKEEETTLEVVEFCLFDEDTYQKFVKVLESL
ncbi:MAG: macro domain-containing protein [Thermodesulfobacteriaceae bacterium]|nr:macro domain-containing protein [Thermodesulfobacteriaceae bacterium]MCX8042380.1 macro domain-containing protein [Thermodesulfobacteriaceae bacterium]MDW8136529.1 macro domain-containing protein [Thermodesulfobacterium sp.]